MTPVATLIVSPAGELENVPPVAPVVIRVVVPVAQKVPPLTVAVGGQIVQVTVLEVVALLPHASIAVKVRVCDDEHEVVDTAPSLNVTVGVPHASEAVAVPSAAVISEAEGLHPRVVELPDVVIVGGAWSCVHVTVLTAVAELPHPSTAVNVLV